ncbi:MAG: hypothetical protein WCV84_04085 [Patescibacteria group bacterium]
MEEEEKVEFTIVEPRRGDLPWREIGTEHLDFVADEEPTEWEPSDEVLRMDVAWLGEVYDRSLAADALIMNERAAAIVAGRYRKAQKHAPLPTFVCDVDGYDEALYCAAQSVAREYENLQAVRVALDPQRDHLESLGWFASERVLQAMEQLTTDPCPLEGIKADLCRLSENMPYDVVRMYAELLALPKPPKAKKSGLNLHVLKVMRGEKAEPPPFVAKRDHLLGAIQQYQNSLAGMTARYAELLGQERAILNRLDAAESRLSNPIGATVTPMIYHRR